MNMSYLFISHDLALVQSICDRVLVMHRGRIVEEGNTQDVIEYAAHPYTKLLLSSVFQFIRIHNGKSLPFLK